MMRRLPTWHCAFLGVAAAVELAAQSQPSDLATVLAAAVDCPDVKARKAAALELLQRRDVAIGQWLEACLGFGAFRPQAAGPHHDEVDLMVAGKREKTTITWFVPRSYDPMRPAPLLLAMHGTGSSGRNEHLMWQQVAEKLGMLLVAPSESGPNEGYAFTERERQVALGAVRWLRRMVNVDEARIFCSGESRGGHMTWDLAVRHPDHFAALAPMIGGPVVNPAGGRNNLRYLENVAATPIRDLQGAKDDPQLVFHVRMAFERLKGFSARDAVLTEFATLGHAFEFAAIDWVEWLGPIRRDPAPQRVVLCFARKSEARAHWLEITSFDKSVEEEFHPKLTPKELEALEKKSLEDKKVWWEKQADDRTGRLVGTWKPDGPIQVDSKGALGLRIILDDGMLGVRKELEVVWNGKRKKVKPERSARVLLLEFVERFDRTFLPVVEITMS